MNHHSVWRGIECIASARNMSCSRLARHSGLDATTFNKSKRWSSDGKPRWPSMLSVAKVLESTGATLEELVKYIKENS